VTKRFVIARRMAVAAGAGAIAALAVAPAFGQAHEPVRAQAASYLGTPASTKDVPWVVSLTLFGVGLKKDPALGRRGYVSACSGAVIGPRRVLTAAHCVDDNDLKTVAVSVGTDDLLKSAGRVVPIARVWVLVKDKRFSTGHDLAVIETKKDLGVVPVAFASERPKVGEVVTSFGYGAGSKAHDAANPHPVLRRYDSVVSADCIAGDENAICTSDLKGGGVRSGDSGGPLVVFRDGVPALVGDLSAGDTATATINVYTNALTQKAFIDAPPDSALFPILREPQVRIAGQLKPGGKVTCAATFTPEPLKVGYSWGIGVHKGKRLSFRDPSTGRKIYYRSVPEPFSRKQSIRIPRDAGGEPIWCSLHAYAGPYHRVALISALQKISAGGAR